MVLRPALMPSTLKARLISRGALDSPWGLQIAPASFGSFAGDLLVGNFGNGMINAYNPTTGTFVGTLDGTDGSPLVIDALGPHDRQRLGGGRKPRHPLFHRRA